MDQDAVTVIHMNVLKRCQAKSQHEGHARLQGGDPTHSNTVYPNGQTADPAT